LQSEFVYICFSHPALGDVSDSIRCPLYPAKDLPVDLYIKIFVGYKTRWHSSSTKGHCICIFRAALGQSP